MLVKLIGNAIVRKHDPIDGDEAFDEFRTESMVLIGFRGHRNRFGNSDCWVHGGFPFLLKNEGRTVPST
jgi:hypothetical protein